MGAGGNFCRGVGDEGRASQKGPIHMEGKTPCKENVATGLHMEKKAPMWKKKEFPHIEKNIFPGGGGIE